MRTKVWTTLAASALWVGACSGNPASTPDADLGPVDASVRDTLVPDQGPEASPLDSAPDVTTSVDASTDSYRFPDGGPACGNGRRDEHEQCDDGNLRRLDGCDHACRFEQVQRITSLRLQFGTDEFCPINTFGPALSLMVRELVQQSWADDIAKGRLNLLIHFLDLLEPTGQTRGPVLAGITWGVPVAGDGYDGLADLDWWYTADTAALDPERVPRALMRGQLTGGLLTLGPGTFPLALNTSATATGPLAAISLVDARMVADPGTPTRPMSSTGTPPGYLADQHLDAELRAFANLNQPGLGAASLCGKITAETLHGAVAPAALSGTGICREDYGTESSFLDVLVGGCTNPVLGNLLRATQPDTDAAQVPAVGSGPPYVLALDDEGHVATCTDRSGIPVDLTPCLKDASISAFFRFSTGRVIAR